MALKRGDGPTAILLTRQNVPAIERTATGHLAEMTAGAYLVAGGDRPDAVLAATGSELHLAMAARTVLEAAGRRINVVSIPCLELFRTQRAVYQQRLFPAGVPVATIEAGCTWPWRGIAGPDGLTIGIDHYGASAPAEINAEKFGFTEDAVTKKIKDWLG